MPEPIYSAWITTGDEPLGGTDSNVYLMLFGSAGQTDWILLPARDAFAFEQGSTDKFMIDAPDVGELTRCCVGHDNSADPGWYVEAVRLRHNPSGSEWTFRFHQWLGEEEAGRLAVCVGSS
jgi:hypothetical protein